MKKPSSKIREEISRLQEQLKQAETREAERIGRIALKAGIGEMEIDETELLTAFEDVAARFRKGQSGSAGSRKPAGDIPAGQASPAIATGEASSSTGEA